MNPIQEGEIFGDEQNTEADYLNEVLEEEKQADIIETQNCLAHEYERGRL